MSDPAPEPEWGDDLAPHLLEAEQSALGAMLLSKDAITDVAEILRPDDFYRGAHKLIFKAVTDLYDRGEPVDAVTVYHRMAQDGQAARSGGALYLFELTRVTPTAVNAVKYARIVEEYAMLRHLAELGAQAQQRALNPQGESADALISHFQGKLADAVRRRTSEDYAPLADLLPDELDNIAALGKRGHITGVPTGFADLDALTQGLQGGQMIIVAARPAVGKSTLALDWLRSAALKHSIPSVMFSLEMGRGEIVQRLLSAEGKIPLHTIKAGALSDEQWKTLARKLGDFGSAPLFIDDSPNLTMPEIRAKCLRLKAQHGLGFVVIDYLQLMNGRSGSAEHRQNDVSEISRAVKLLAKELAIPVVAVCQLNRGPEQRSDKRPMVSDLRESGSLEQDADMVILIHREDVYAKETPRAGEADLIVGKHRNGPTTTLTVAFQGHYSRFVDMAWKPSEGASA